MQKVIRRVVPSTQLKGNTIMNTILNVTPAGLSNEEIDRLKSEVAKKAIYRTAIFYQPKPDQLSWQAPEV